MHITRGTLKDGRTFAGIMWEFNVKKGYFTLQDGDHVDTIYFEDCTSIITEGERISRTQVGNMDELNRYRKLKAIYDTGEDS